MDEPGNECIEHGVLQGQLSDAGKIRNRFLHYLDVIRKDERWKLEMPGAAPDFVDRLRKGDDFRQAAEDDDDRPCRRHNQCLDHVADVVDFLLVRISGHIVNLVEVDHNLAAPFDAPVDLLPYDVGGRIAFDRQSQFSQSDASERFWRTKRRNANVKGGASRIGNHVSRKRRVASDEPLER